MPVIEPTTMVPNMDRDIREIAFLLTVIWIVLTVVREGSVYFSSTSWLLDEEVVTSVIVVRIKTRKTRDATSCI